MPEKMLSTHTYRNRHNFEAFEMSRNKLFVGNYANF